jgi:hypothetical protein
MKFKLKNDGPVTSFPPKMIEAIKMMLVTQVHAHRALQEAERFDVKQDREGAGKQGHMTKY